MKKFKKGTLHLQNAILGKNLTVEIADKLCGDLHNLGIDTNIWKDDDSDLCGMDFQIIRDTRKECNQLYQILKIQLKGNIKGCKIKEAFVADGDRMF